jgi:hypothetical protein
MKKIIAIITLLFWLSNLSAQKTTSRTISVKSKEFVDFTKSKEYKSINFRTLGQSDRIELISTDKTKGEAIVITYLKKKITLIVTKHKLDYQMVLIKSTYEGKDKNSGKIEYCDGNQKPFFYQNIKNGKVTLTSKLIGSPLDYRRTYKECVDHAEEILKQDFLGDIALCCCAGVAQAIRIACAINSDCFD